MSRVGIGAATATDSSTRALVMQNIVGVLRTPTVKNLSFCARPKERSPALAPGPFMFLCPGNSTCVTDIGRSVRVSRKLGRIGLSGRSVDVCVPETQLVTDVTDVDSRVLVNDQREHLPFW